MFDPLPDESSEISKFTGVNDWDYFSPYVYPAYADIGNDEVPSIVSGAQWLDFSDYDRCVYNSLDKLAYLPPRNSRKYLYRIRVSEGRCVEDTSFLWVLPSSVGILGIAVVPAERDSGVEYAAIQSYGMEFLPKGTLSVVPCLDIDSPLKSCAGLLPRVHLPHATPFAVHCLGSAAKAYLYCIDRRRLFYQESYPESKAYSERVNGQGNEDTYALGLMQLDNLAFKGKWDIDCDGLILARNKLMGRLDLLPLKSDASGTNSFGTDSFGFTRMSDSSSNGNKSIR